ncbi:ubiquitin-like protein ISG15 [Narcine bancroftii]|uniref:ubiquitin-like protein ISG15 n=1 Tax=Narcine bancroftii TaxID=1343680 RepID=UPI003831CD59
MRLIVKQLIGQTIALDVDPSMEVSTLKMKIQENIKVPVYLQHLMVQNVELQNSRRLCEYNLTSSPTVMLLIKKEEPMQIFLVNDKGRTTTYDVMPSNSVEDFKKQVHQQEGVTPDQQRLMYESKQLQDGHLLSDYNIGPQSTIHLLLRLRGG